MHFHLHGVYTTAEGRTLYESGVLRWRPIWALVVMTCKDFLNEKDIRGGNTNQGYYIPPGKAETIGMRLSALAAGTNKKQRRELMAVAHVDWDDVWKFSAFCRQSGGFTIGHIPGAPRPTRRRAVTDLDSAH